MQQQKQFTVLIALFSLFYIMKCLVNLQTFARDFSRLKNPAPLFLPLVNVLRDVNEVPPAAQRVNTHR